VSKSILQWDDRVCFKCGRNGVYDALDEHHVFGKYNRNKSEKDGLKVWLCHSTCHIFGPKSVHQDSVFDFELKRFAQIKAMEHYGWTKNEFIERYGKSYI
jgi:hypothetical protein